MVYLRKVTHKIILRHSYDNCTVSRSPISVLAWLDLQYWVTLFVCQKMLPLRQSTSG